MIDQALGTTSISTAMRTLSSEDCNDLCHLMSTSMTRCQETNIDTNEVAYGLQDSFAGDNLSHEELLMVVEVWANIEDNDNVVAVEMDEAFGRLDSTVKTVIPLADNDPMDVCDEETANQTNESGLVDNDMNVTELFGHLKEKLWQQGMGQLVYKVRELEVEHNQLILSRSTHQTSLKSYFTKKK